jgi:Fe-S oxidoreductase/FAD/FMN-containing dehydrogenase
VVLDQLNQFLKPHGFQFGPDVATSSRATLGGMIANNSSGARAPRFGCTGEHVASLELLLADGRIASVDATHPGILEPLRQRLERLVELHGDDIRRHQPPGLVKHHPGYALDRCLEDPARALLHVLAGSEGTLAGIFSAELRVVPLPREKGLAVLFFPSVPEALQATVALLDLQPVAIEHVDRILFDQTRGQRAFQAARDLLRLDEAPAEAFLIIEFYEDVAERLQAVASRRLGQRTLLLRHEAEMQLVWGLRKAGLSLLTGMAGPAKPATCIEDVAVRPEQLPAYYAAVAGLLKKLDISACFYGHAASGLLHIRPVLDLHTPQGRRHLRLLSDEVSALCREFNGSLAAEHGVGIARTEYLPHHLGPRLMQVCADIKNLFDPRHLLNPGKIIPDGRFHVDTRLRTTPEAPLALPFTPRLAFAARDGSFLANLEQCNGCGGCLKATPTMCPTYIATGEEALSTRGRANTLRAALAGKLGAGGLHALTLAELDYTLGTCLSCKACQTECPSNVNLALLKAEVLQARHAHHGLPLAARLISHTDRLGRLGCAAPRLTNFLLHSAPGRRLLQRFLGFSAQRFLPAFASQRFDAWFDRRPPWPSPAPRGAVLLWDDCFTRYHHPHIGQAAVHVLEAAGFEVLRLRQRRCCGRPAFSQGNLDEAARLGRHNLQLLAAQPEALPILFLEPSCWAMFAEDYRELNLPHAAAFGGRCRLFSAFLDDLLCREPEALTLQPLPRTAAIHAHCHAKALLSTAFLPRLAARVPHSTARLLDTGCCGMAGAFGYQQEHYALSLQVARPLLDQLNALPPDAQVIAEGASCRQQIEHLTPHRPWHMAEWLAAALPRNLRQF